MSNLFVVHTQLQMLTAYIIANNFFENDENQLVFINHDQEQLYQECFYVQKMIDDTSTWQVLRFKSWLGKETRFSEFKQNILQMKQALLHNRPKYDRVFLGEDKTFQNQLIVELSGNNRYFRMEDGVWSYYSPKRSWSHKLWHGMKIRAMRFLADQHSDMVYNVGGVGYGKAAVADYLYKPHLLERYSPHVIPIERKKVINTMEKLIGKTHQYQDQLPREVILFLGSRLVENGKISANVEIEILRHICDLCNQQGLTLLYKPHPVEETSKLEIYKKKLTEMEFCLIREPIEILYYCLNNLKCVLGHSSSGLLFADVFSKDVIQTIGLFKLYGYEESDPVLNRLMEKAGVIIPNNITELKDYLRVLN